MKKAGIYKIVNLKNNKIYIGSSSNLKSRKYTHFKLLENNKHCNIKLQNSYNLHGKINFKWEVIEEVQFNENKQILKENLLEREQYWIDKYFGKDCYNFNPIAGSRLGSKDSEETIEKKRISCTGKKRSEEFKQKMKELSKLENHINPCFKGRKHSDESINKNREAHRGKKLSEETKDKIGNALRNKPLSEETKKKMSEAKKGRVLSEEHRKKLSEAKKGKTGRKHSEETKQKLKEAHTGKKFSEEHKQKLSYAHKIKR